ncbi:MAG: substrate-binding periplasmic protein [Desulfobacteraceae bacterium]
MNRLVFICFFCMIFSASAFAGSITVVLEQYPPYEFRENRKWTGHDIEIVAEASRRAGVTPVFMEFPWKRCLQMVRDGSAQAIISLMNTPDRREYILYPDTALSYEKNVILGHREKFIEIKSLGDLKGKSIGVQSGYSYGDEFDNYPGLMKDFSFSQELLLKKLDAERTDFVIGNEAVTLYLNKKLGLKPVEVFYVVSQDPLYIGFSKVHRESGVLLEKFSTILSDMKKEGTIDRIIEKYQ